MRSPASILPSSPSWRGRLLSHLPPLAAMLVPALGLTLGGCREDAGSPTAPESAPSLAATSAQTLSFRQVSAGGAHTCGVTTDNRAYCWGVNNFGQLGDGTTGDRIRPVAVGGGHQFLQVRAGDNHTCGLTTDDRAYCWGNNDAGQLGDGTILPRSLPVAVLGGRRFSQVRPGYRHTCAVNTVDVAFCWGWNFRGQLGDGTQTDRRAPVRVAGALLFRLVVAGGFHTCGVTTDHRAYCWGKNDDGAVGDGTLHIRLRPVAVVGGLRFRQVIAGTGIESTCGVTLGDRAYCWGENRYGRLGDGTTTRRLRPTAVRGGLSFSGVALGQGHTCGVTLAGAAYCWGYNQSGQLGNGTNTRSLTPVAVLGGLRFVYSGVTAGGNGVHTCGLTTSNRAYCWGSNFAGQLGDGTMTDRLTPVPVAGPT
jgi:alpha-tubulin suppressor-like RCC1 family protein